MNIGLFFGSFNPIHIGHQIIAQYLLEFTELDQIWIIVSPQNPLKDPDSLIHAYDRLEMCKLAFEDQDAIQVKDIELHLPQPSYTIDTLTYLKERYTAHQFSLIMGEDNLLSLPKWKNYELLLRLTHNGVKVMSIPRIGYQHVNFREDSLFWSYKNDESVKLEENEVKFWLDTAKKEFFFKNKRDVKYAEA